MRLRSGKAIGTNDDGDLCTICFSSKFIPITFASCTHSICHECSSKILLDCMYRVTIVETVGGFLRLRSKPVAKCPYCRSEIDNADVVKGEESAIEGRYPMDFTNWEKIKQRLKDDERVIQDAIDSWFARNVDMQEMMRALVAQGWQGAIVKFAIGSS